MQLFGVCCTCSGRSLPDLFEDISWEERAVEEENLAPADRKGMLEQAPASPHNREAVVLEQVHFQSRSESHALLSVLTAVSLHQCANLQGVKMLCSNAEGASLKGCNFEDPSGLKANLEGKKVFA